MYKVTSFDLKLAIIEYYRFKHQFIVTDECCNNWDIGAHNYKEIVEVEIKISKKDLLKEKSKTLNRKNKHQLYSNARSNQIPNRFIFCVPEHMKDYTINFAKELNPKYGVFVFDEKKFLKSLPCKKMNCHDIFLKNVKRSSLLHKRYNKKLERLISLRASSKMASLMHKEYLQKI